ncbi:MAG: serine/threonine protein kinase, partial [Chloroflexi bacterium]|nr:serine/threonine protein kinase [Chloroflexota bacterium]
MENISGLSNKGYELKGKLGSGGMGTVYQAYQIAMKREVAIKILPEELADNPNYFVRFNREAETLTQLEHPHIVPVYDYGTVGRTSYIVMRMLTGGTLNQRLLTGKPMLLADTRQIIQQVTSALDYAHRKGIVHRDIKASNVMLDEQGNAYLTDFGIAKLLDSTTGFTATGMMLGTPAYMAPEQWKGSDSSAQTDIYALGVLLYAMLTGQMPFEAPTPYALMDKHLNASPKPPTDYQPTLPNGINRVIEKALAKDPQQRYSSAGALSDAFIAETGSATDRMASDVRTMALEEVPTTQVEQEYVSEQPTTLVSQPATRPLYLRPVVAAPAIVLVLAILIGGFLAFNSNGDNEDTTDNPDALVASDATDTDIPTTATATDTPTETEAAGATATNGSAATSAGQTSTSATAETPISPTSAVTNPSPTTPPPTETPRTPTATFTVAVTDTDTPTNTSTSTDTPTNTSTNTPTNTPSDTPTFTVTPTPSFTPSRTFTASPTASPTTSFGLPGGVPVTANNQWQPVERTINGVPMVLVP